MKRLAASLALAILAIPALALAQAKPEMIFVSPRNNDTVAGPKVHVHLLVGNFTLVAAGQPVRPGEGHAHILIDRDPFPTGEAIPTDLSDVVHMGKPPFDQRTIDLPNGKHTITLQLADSGHHAMDVVARDVITVADGFRGKGDLNPACAEVATGTGHIRLIFPLVGGAVQGSVDSQCTFKTEGGACTFTEFSDRRIYGSPSEGLGYVAKTKEMDGHVSTFTRKALTSGTRARCGQDAGGMAPEAVFHATFDGTQVTGTIGQLGFTATSDPGTIVATAPPEATPAPAIPTVTALPTTKAKSSSPVAIPIAVVAVLVIAGIVVVRRRRAPGVPVSVPAAGGPSPIAPSSSSAPAPTPTPAPAPVAETRMAPADPVTPATPSAGTCASCGAERRTGSKFCTNCGRPY